MAPLRLLRLLLPSLLALGLFACGSSSPDSHDVAVRVGYVALDQRSQSPVVVLEELDGERMLPIWIGFAEAQSIAAKLQDREPPRPNTHDLAEHLIEQLDGAVERVVVTRLSNGIYYAVLVLRVHDRLVEVDSRPSDAIAIALRSGAPLFVRDPLFQETESLDLGVDLGDQI